MMNDELKQNQDFRRSKLFACNRTRGFHFFLLV